VHDATSAITKMDDALNYITKERGIIGAQISRFDSVISNLKTRVETSSNSLSRIQDSDFAKETASLVGNQILQQAGVAMLAQANQLPQMVLSLIQR